MSRAAVTHFDGDPIVLDFWLLLYEKFWRGEVNTVYADVCYDPELVSPELLERQKKSLERFPEIKVEFVSGVHAPEWSNPRLIERVVEDYLLLVESDGWIFGKGIVDKYFKVLEGDTHDLVAGNYRLFPECFDELVGYVGFMRNFFFVKTDYLKSLDVNFDPRKIQGHDFDCFGYISYQLALKKPRVTYVPCNFVTDPPENDLVNYPWLHIRQMNSSILGFGNAGNGIFKGFEDGNTEIIEKIKSDVAGNPFAAWLYYKACAMRLLMVYVLRDFSPFADKYKETMKKMVFSLSLDWDKVQGMVTYYRTVMKV